MDWLTIIESLLPLVTQNFPKAADDEALAEIAIALIKRIKAQSGKSTDEIISDADLTLAANKIKLAEDMARLGPGGTARGGGAGGGGGTRGGLGDCTGGNPEHARSRFGRARVARLALARLREQPREPRRHERLALQSEHCRAQSALVETARTRRRECLVFTAPAAHVASLLLRQTRGRERAALPTKSLVAFEDARRVPALRARGRVRARLDALRAARRASVRVEERERRVGKQVECARDAHLKVSLYRS